MKPGSIIMSQRIKPECRAGVSEAKEVQTQPSAGKMMAAVFWDAQGIIMLDFLAKNSTITDAYYANLLD